jgi:hypothetical protein
MKYYQHLRLPFEHDYSEIAKWNVPNPEILGYQIMKETMFDSRLYDLLYERGVRMAHVSMFYTPPKTLLPIHSDHAGQPRFAKLNFCYGASGARMFWYKLKPNYVPEMIVTEDHKKYRVPEGEKVSYVSMTSADCTFAASALIGTPTLLDAGSPHSVVNNTDEARWVLSIPMRSVQDNHLLDFDETAELLKDLRV